MFFSDVGGKAERGAHYYIHTRVSQVGAGVYIRERKRKYRKGEEDAQRKTERESKEKKKRWRKREKRGWSKRKHQITDIFCYIKHRVNNGDWIQ